ncbi:MAG: 50S ribosomal protein L6 [Thermoplasmatales archaeon]|nr:50S ribosomal protein L6 [Thermoplasmatales archaeon]
MARIPDIKKEITIPEGIKATIINNILTINGEKGSLSREFTHPKIQIKIKDNTIALICKNPRKKQKALFGTFIAHINNMIKGTTKEFEYKMKTVFSHFPIKLSVEGKDFFIQNFLGERASRKALILEGVNVDIEGDDVTVHGIDIEKVGQTVANIERATLVRNRDVRVFQDGVYRTSKGEK